MCAISEGAPSEFISFLCWYIFSRELSIRVRSVVFIVFTINFESCVKKKKLPLDPPILDSPCLLLDLKMLSRLFFGSRDFIISSYEMPSSALSSENIFGEKAVTVELILIISTKFWMHSFLYSVPKNSISVLSVGKGSKNSISIG